MRLKFEHLALSAILPLAFMGPVGCATESDVDEEESALVSPAEQTFRGIVTKSKSVRVSATALGGDFADAIFGKQTRTKSVLLRGGMKDILLQTFGISRPNTLKAGVSIPTPGCPSPLKVELFDDELGASRILSFNVMCPTDGETLESVLYQGKSGFTDTPQTNGARLHFVGEAAALKRILARAPFRAADLLTPITKAHLVSPSKDLDLVKTESAIGIRPTAGELNRETAIRLGIEAKCPPAVEIDFFASSMLAKSISPEKVVRVRVCDDYRTLNLYTPSGGLIGMLFPVANPARLKAAIEK